MLMPFGILAPKKLLNYFIMSVPDEGYSRNASCSLISISTFLITAIRFISTLLDMEIKAK
jgi:hypothetical protein